MQTILILLFSAAALFIYKMFIYEDPDLLDKYGNHAGRKGKIKHVD